MVMVDQAPSIDPMPAGPETLGRLKAAVAAFASPGFAVVDGGLFVDLPGLLKRERLFARSLFLDAADVAVQAAGPWLVALDQAPDAAARVMALPAAKPAMTFWSCAGEMVLYRHLRSLNMARVPDWAADGEAAPADPAAAPVYEPVFFRHWDPRVLGALLPCLDAAQFARMLGPAVEIAFMAPEHGGLRRVVKALSWPPAPTGMLTVRPEQFQAMLARRVSASHKRLAMFLRTYAHEHTFNLDDAQMSALAERHIREAKHMGVREERSVGLWSYMQTTSIVDLSREEIVVRYIADPRVGPSPDARMACLFELRTRMLKEKSS